MSFDKLKAALAEIEKIKAELLATYQPKLTDKSISLDDRWSMFEQMCAAHLLGNNGYGSGFLTELAGKPRKLSLYDNFNVERYETITYLDMYEIIQEDLKDDEDKYEPENIDAWREAVLASGYMSITHDW